MQQCTHHTSRLRGLDARRSQQPVHCRERIRGMRQRLRRVLDLGAGVSGELAAKVPGGVGQFRGAIARDFAHSELRSVRLGPLGTALKGHAAARRRAVTRTLPVLRRGSRRDVGQIRGPRQRRSAGPCPTVVGPCECSVAGAHRSRHRQGTGRR